MIPGFKFTPGQGRGRSRLGRVGRRSSRLRRLGRAIVAQGQRRFGEGGTAGETPGEVIREAGRAVRRRFRRGR